MTLRALTSLVGASLTLGGCSFFMTPAPTSWTRGQPLTCSDSNAAPVVDTLGAVAGLGAVAWVWQAYGDGCDSNGGNCEGPGGPLIFSALVAVPIILYAIAAIHGYRTAEACEDLEAQAGPAIVPQQSFMPVTTLPSSR